MLRVRLRRANFGVAFSVAGLLALAAAGEAADPTFLYRRLDRVQAAPSELTSNTCRYKPLFGAGDSQAGVAKGVARFGEITVDPGGASGRAAYPSEEQVYFVLAGRGVLRYGTDEHPLDTEDFLYLPPGVKHAVANPQGEPLRILVMGYHLPKGAKITTPDKLLIANTRLAKKQVVGNHPTSTLYQLLVGGVKSQRDVIAAGHVLTSLFLMDIAPGGTNQPHHHPREEEIYLLLEGKGDMVAGGGADGIEGRHPATAGDAYFIRLNATVGFYADDSPGAGHARVLAVRSLYPGL
jgi:mannose-6-phosphate isomerase-like protein (cupin superfamily)